MLDTHTLVRIKQKKSVQCAAVGDQRVLFVCVGFFFFFGRGCGSFVHPFLSPHCWIIASEGRRGAPGAPPSPHVKASLNLRAAISRPPPHPHDSHPPLYPDPLLSSLHLPDWTPPANSRPAIRFRGNLGRAVGRLSEVGLHYPLGPAPLPVRR